MFIFRRFLVFLDDLLCEKIFFGEFDKWFDELFFSVNVCVDSENNFFFFISERCVLVSDL